MLIIEFDAPTTPVSTNRANRLHWAHRHRLLKPWRYAAFDATIKAPLSSIRSLASHEKLVVTVHLPFKTNRRRDPHNYVGTNVKAIVDGLVDAGLLVDDTAEYVQVNEPVLAVGTTNRVVVYIQGVE